MAVITPNSEIYLLKSPIELDEDNQLDFSNATAQHNYFNSLTKVTMTNATFQRKDGYIRWPASMESILGYNYCMYRNKSHGNKWFYAFITNIEYENDSCSKVFIKTDAWQTYMFDITFKASFVEREHVNDDTFGKHTVPEGLDTGDYVCNDAIPYEYIYAKANDTTLSPVVMLQVTKTHLTTDGGYDNTFPSPDTPIFNGIPQGCSCFGFRLKSGEMGRFYSTIAEYDAAGAGDAIVSISLVPYWLNSWTTKTDTMGNSYLVPVGSWTTTPTLLPDYTRNTTLDGYTPKNNKMFTGEFNYVYITNNAGTDITYNWENFNSGIMDFAIAGALEQGGSVKLYPQNSLKSAKGVSGNCWSEGISGMKLPCISWSSDYYLNWQAVNGSNIEVQTALTGGKFAVGAIGAMLGNPVTSAGSLLGLGSEIANTLQKIKEAELTPPQAKGNVATGDINFSNGKAGFTFRRMCVRYEYAKMIDDYFTMFGYKVNSLKTPNVTGRRYWNYVKTKGCNILGDIPQEDMQTIKGLFNRGVTIWHDSTKFLDYTQTNSIVS